MSESLKDKLRLSSDPVDKEIEPLDNIETEVDFDFMKELENDDESVAEIKSEHTKPKKKAKMIDINKLVINQDSTPMEKEANLRNALYGNKPAFQVVAAQSGYYAKIIPLVNKDVINLLMDNVSRYEYRKTLFKVIYDKLVGISVGKMSFEEWLKSTSSEDVETFYYGLYCATFPDEGTYTFTCPKCHTEETIKINHNNLFKTTDKEKMKKLIADVSKNSHDKDAMKKYSLVGKSQTFELSDSGIIVDITTPSLWDALEILRTVPERVIDRDEYSVTNMMYIKQMLIPDKENKNYISETDNQEILRIIDNLTIDDSEELRDVVADHVNENRISYSIKNIKCQSCQNEVKEIPISIENILFTLIFEKSSI